MRFGSLFAGIGGIDLGFERAGLECAWQVEIDPFCNRVLERHWPDVPRWGDIKEIDWRNVERPDLIAGGFPCQPVSAAGRQRAQADERWLWPEFARCLRELRPRWVVIENVPALLTADGGRPAQEVFGDLSALGFDARWGVLPASAFGAPHLRKRLYIVAHANGQRRPQRPERNGQPLEPGLEAPFGDDAVRRHPVVAHAQRPGLEEPELQQTGRQRQAAQRGGDQRWAGPAQPGLGRGVDGLPAGLDGHCWPARPREPQHEWEPPRTALGVRDRPARLTALGNAVVPQVAEWLGRNILAVENTFAARVASVR